jgi:hypothetical protein
MSYEFSQTLISLTVILAKLSSIPEKRQRNAPQNLNKNVLAKDNASYTICILLKKGTEEVTVADRVAQH